MILKNFFPVLFYIFITIVFTPVFANDDTSLLYKRQTDVESYRNDINSYIEKAYSSPKKDEIMQLTKEYAASLQYNLAQHISQDQQGKLVDINTVYNELTTLSMKYKKHINKYDKKIVSYLDKLYGTISEDVGIIRQKSKKRSQSSVYNKLHEKVTKLVAKYPQDQKSIILNAITSKVDKLTKQQSNTAILSTLLNVLQDLQQELETNKTITTSQI